MQIRTKSFTDFQNVRLKGGKGGANSARESELYFTVGATGSKDGTVTIALRGGSQEFPYLNVANAGLHIGTGFIEITHLGGSFSGTVAVSTLTDANYAWKFPAMSGSIPVCGTFTVQMPAISAGAFSETAVAVTGLRADAAFVCTLQDSFNTVTTDRGMAALIGAMPANGFAQLLFFNFGTTATIPNTMYCAYTMTR